MSVSENVTIVKEPSSLDAIWALPIPPAQKVVLIALAEQPGATAAEIAAQTGYCERQAKAILYKLAGDQRVTTQRQGGRQTTYRSTVLSYEKIARHAEIAQEKIAQQKGIAPVGCEDIAHREETPRENIAQQDEGLSNARLHVGAEYLNQQDLLINSQVRNGSEVVEVAEPTSQSREEKSEPIRLETGLTALDHPFVQAWIAESPPRFREQLTTSAATWTAIHALEAMNATADEVSAEVRNAYKRPRDQGYAFKFLLEDIAKTRAKATIPSQVKPPPPRPELRLYVAPPPSTAPTFTPEQQSEMIREARRYLSLNLRGMA